MLDLDTRRRIDNARDILVGKVPDPKSQVEQITIALIYKFMDDMDNEAKELGGKATFFKGEFAKYSWSNIFDPKLGGIELISLYGEAITKMNQNKNIPQLFRDIFKNAYLPYRDPETLKSFLKEINDFHYDHSERLGDAFEYLLSVLGVQGDAGSLRTPRHIIDFIVEVLDPKKNETILDPACGTAGFLISAYKHILKQNTDKRQGLTPDDRKRLMNSIVGYDISPDMVRLSLVNMYLHGFQTPKIYEYDSLTSDDRWNDTFDIILANPPFMTPKGGIRPHKRFSIQANRSNDGFDLGAQRRDIDRNNLPDALKILQAYKEILQEGKKAKLTESKKELAHLVAKAKIAEIGDYNLTGDRYRERVVHVHKEWPMVALGEVCEFIRGITFSAKDSAEHNYVLVATTKAAQADGLRFDDLVKVRADIIKNEKTYLQNGDLLISVANSSNLLGRKTFVRNVGERQLSFGAFMGCLRPNKKQIKPEFLNPFLESDKYKEFCLSRANTTTNISNLNWGDLSQFKIPLPPLSIQQGIVAEIEGYQKIIDGARQIVENYKPRIKVDESWEMVELGDVCNFMTGGTPTSTVKEYYENGTIPWLVSGDIHKGEIFDCEGRITKKGVESSNAKYLPKDSVLIALNGQGKTRGTVALLRMEKATCNQSLVSINPKDKNTLVPEFIYYQLKSMYQEIREITGDNQRSGLNIQIVKAIKIPLPPLKIQKQIVAQIEEEQKLIEANKKLIEIFEDKIKTKIAEVWG